MRRRCAVSQFFVGASLLTKWLLLGIESRRKELGAQMSQTDQKQKHESNESNDRLVLQVGLVIGACLTLVHQYLVSQDDRFSILGINFGPGGSDWTLKYSVLLLLIFAPAQVILLDASIKRKKMAASICFAVGFVLYRSLMFTSVGTTVFYSHLVPVLPGLSILALLSLLLVVMLNVGRQRTAIFLEDNGTRVVKYLFESRKVIPVFLAGFMLTIFSSEITRVVTGIEPSRLFLFIGGGILVSAGLQFQPGSQLVERIVAATLLWVVISIGVFVLGTILVSNDELARWGAEKWVSCGWFDSSPVRMCSEAATIPRFKISAVLGGLGTVSTLAQSLVPPISK